MQSSEPESYSDYMRIAHIITQVRIYENTKHTRYISYSHIDLVYRELLVYGLSTRMRLIVDGCRVHGR